MTSFRLIMTGLAMALLLICSASAVELTIPSVTGAPADKIGLPVQVKNFAAVAGVELHIEFDSLQLAIDSVVSKYMDGATINSSAAGAVHLIWENYQSALTLADNATLLTLYVRVIGTHPATAAVAFSGGELVSEVGDILSLTLNNGGINIIISDVNDPNGARPGRFELRQNYPNPFNPSTTISYSIARAADMVLEIYNIAGQRVDRIALGYHQPGSYAYTYLAGGLASGIYSYRLSGDGVSQSKSMVLVK
jgi:hypothetical protein